MPMTIPGFTHSVGPDEMAHNNGHNNQYKIAKMNCSKNLLTVMVVVKVLVTLYMPMLDGYM